MKKQLFFLRIFFILLSCFVYVEPRIAIAQPLNWPRDFMNADGSKTQILQPPQRILSTSVTLTGTLLAINAPVVASATAMNGQFFTQWESLANERQITKLWPAGSADLELAYLVEPDVIFVAVNGADSAQEQIAELKKIAPVIVLDYAQQTWQELAKQMAAILGLEMQTQHVIEEFEMYLQQSKAQLSLPFKQANIIHYLGSGTSNRVSTDIGTHAQLLQTLGFIIENPNPQWQINRKYSKDFIWMPYEHLTQLKAPMTFLHAADKSKVTLFIEDPILANLPSVKNGHVYHLGVNSLKIDYFSAKEIIGTMIEHFDHQD